MFFKQKAFLLCTCAAISFDCLKSVVHRKVFRLKSKCDFSKGHSASTQNVLEMKNKQTAQISV